MGAKIKKHDYIFAVGRRRTSVARVRLYKGKNQHLVNEKPIGQYFSGVEEQKLWNNPFILTKTEGKYYITAKVQGGGKKGQLGAVIHGTARALVKAIEDSKLTLRQAGLLTRDSRTRERRKIGTGGKARRAKQSPKR